MNKKTIENVKLFSVEHKKGTGCRTMHAMKLLKKDEKANISKINNVGNMFIEEL